MELAVRKKVPLKFQSGSIAQCEPVEPIARTKIFSRSAKRVPVIFGVTEFRRNNSTEKLSAVRANSRARFRHLSLSLFLHPNLIPHSHRALSTRALFLSFFLCSTSIVCRARVFPVLPPKFYRPLKLYRVWSGCSIYIFPHPLAGSLLSSSQYQGNSPSTVTVRSVILIAIAYK